MRRELKSYWRVSANLEHECQSNCAFCNHPWTIFQTILEIWMKSKVSAFTKTFTLWKSATKATRMATFSLTTAGSWNGMWWLPSTRGSPWKIFYPWIDSFVYFSVYSGTIWAFSKYISLEFSIICLIQKENQQSYNTVQYISSKSLYLKNLFILEKWVWFLDSAYKPTLKSAIIYSTLKTV